MDLIIDGLESRKNGDKYHDFVLTDAINNIKKAQEVLDEGLNDPKKWWDNTLINTKTWLMLFPIIYTIQQQLSHNLPQSVEESSQSEPVEDSTVEDTSGLE
jgi:hypothetical protein